MVPTVQGQRMKKSTPQKQQAGSWQEKTHSRDGHGLTVADRGEKRARGNATKIFESYIEEAIILSKKREGGREGGLKGGGGGDRDKRKRKEAEHKGGGRRELNKANDYGKKEEGNARIGVYVTGTA